MIENLERRALFAVTLTNGILEIVGTPGDDHIILQRANLPGGPKGEGKLIDVRFNHQRSSFVGSEVTEIRIVGGEGKDSIRNAYYADELRIPIFKGLTTDPFYVGPRVRIEGGVGDDAISGSPTTERLSGGEGRDTVIGGGGRDLLRGGTGNDVLISGPLEDTIYGDAGNDHIIVQQGRARVDIQTGDQVQPRKRGLVLDLDGTVRPEYLFTGRLNERSEAAEGLPV
jgi:Ca2+-binding RTX toxin-like protein